MKKIIYITPFLIFFSSCNKEEPEILDKFQGDYHLTYTEISETELAASTELTHDFGLMITEKNLIKTFVNGQRFGAYKFVEIKEHSENYTSLYFQKKHSGSTFKYILKLFTDGHIEFYDFPINNKKNVFHP